MLACFPRTGLALRPRRTLRGSSREAPVGHRWLGGDDCALRCGRPPCTDWYQQLPAARTLLYLLKKELVPTATFLVTTRTVTDGASNDCRWVEVYGDPGVTKGDQEGISSGTSGTERKPMKSRSGSGRAQLCSAPAPRPSAAGPCVGPEATDARCPASRGAPTRCLRQRVRGGRADWPTQRWLAQRGAPAPGRAGLWSSSFTGAREEAVGPGRLRAPLIHGLLKLNILWEAVVCGDCVSFAHQSFQMLLGPCSTCCREGRGRRGHPDAPGAEGASDRKLLPASGGSSLSGS